MVGNLGASRLPSLPGGPGLPDVAGRVAVITGASRGLGAGLAARFAAHGLRLGLCARTRPDAPPGTAAGAAADADTDDADADIAVLTAAVDVTDAAALDGFAAAVAERLGPIALWVNNAGVLDPIGPLREADPAAVEAHVRTNVVGVLAGSATYARHVRSRPGGGVLVNVSSGAARSVYAGWAPYGASKAAVDQATRVIAAEEADAGLRALAVAPGVVDTDMQATIRATPASAFPSVERFLDIAAADAFNTPAWVADHLLWLAFGVDDEDVDDVVVRVPDEPGRS